MNKISNNRNKFELDLTDYKDDEIWKQILDYINYTDDLEYHPEYPERKLSTNDKSWLQDGFTTAIIISLLLEIRNKINKQMATK